MISDKYNFKVDSCWKDTGYQQSIVLFENIINLEITNIEIDHGWRETEMDYYERLFKKYELENKPKILMIIPIKYKIPEVEQYVSFDFEVAVLDLRHKSLNIKILYYIS